MMKKQCIFAALATLTVLASCGEGDGDVANRNDPATTGHTTPVSARSYEAVGEVISISDSAATIAHGPVEEVEWPAMTMTFGMSSAELAQAISIGDQVSFDFQESASGYALTSIEQSEL